MSLWEVVTFCGIPSALMSAVIGLGFWYLKKVIARNEQKRDEQGKNIESLVLMMLQSTRANTVLCTATAEAVRDGHCNGNMTDALEAVGKVAKAEKEFLLDKSIKYIFE